LSNFTGKITAPKNATVSSATIGLVVGAIALTLLVPLLYCLRREKVRRRQVDVRVNQ
jgi:hypothetical protein